MPIDKLIRRFQAADRDTRLEALLDASRKLPPVPDHLNAAADREAHRVTECQTPVFLWLEREGDTLQIHADVPRESPTVRGFVALLLRELHGAPLADARDLPPDLLHRLGLDEALGMLRSQGLTAVVQRIRRGAAQLE